MPKESHVKIEVEIPAWLLKRAARNGNTRAVLENEVGREAVERGIRGTKK
jgi:hypothetical protein